MKKLSLILLVIGFALGFAGQVRAEFTPNLDKDDFAMDEEIVFDELAVDIGSLCQEYVAIANQYEEQYGVTFSGVVFGEQLYNGYYMSNPYGAQPPVAASNFNSCKLEEEMGIDGEPITVFFDPAVTRVGFEGFSYGYAPYGEITVTAFRGGAAIGSVTQGAFPATFIGIGDTEGIDAIQIEANGYLYDKVNVFFIDNLTFGGALDTTPAVVKVKVNIKPPDCLGARIAMDEKWINGKSKGVTPVVIMGDEAYDVTKIDPDSILLQGVEPVRWALEDAVHCNAEYGDEMLDLTLKFNTEDLVQAMRDSLDAEDLEALEDGMPVSLNLNLTGNLYDFTTPIENDGDLRVTIIMKGKHQHENRGRGPHPLEHDRGKHKGWDKNR